MRKYEKSCFIIHIFFSLKAFCSEAHPLNTESSGKDTQAGKCLKIILHNAFHIQFIFPWYFFFSKKGLIFLSDGLHVKWKNNPVCLSDVVLLIITAFLMVTIETWHPYLPLFSAPWKKLFIMTSLINWKLGFTIPTGICKCNNSICHFFLFGV